MRRKKNDPSVTQVLFELNEGRSEAFEELFSIVYQELKKRAKRQRSHWHNLHTLNTTALINEAYLKLVKNPHLGWESRTHFLSVAAKTMRHILIDYAKNKQTHKRGGQEIVTNFDDLFEQIPMTELQMEELLSFDKALSKLSKINKRESEIVEYKIFAGMTTQETSATLGISEATVKRDWTMAKTWLMREMA